MGQDESIAATLAKAKAEKERLRKASLQEEFKTITTSVKTILDQLSLEGKTPEQLAVIRNGQTRLLEDAFRDYELAEPGTIQIHLDPGQQVATTQEILVRALSGCLNPHSAWWGPNHIFWRNDIIRPHAAEAIPLRYGLNGSESLKNRNISPLISENPITRTQPSESTIGQLIPAGLAQLVRSYGREFIKAGIVTYTPRQTLRRIYSIPPIA